MIRVILHIVRHYWLGIALFVFCGIALAAPNEQGSNRGPFDVLIFAPHPDDEVLGCAGVVLRALEAKKRVGVIVLTNGDGFPKAASVVSGKPQDQLTPADFLKLGTERQRQSIEGVKLLGLPVANLTFLGYPDSLLAKLYQSNGIEQFRQQFTGKDTTHSLAAADFHSAVHGRPAPFTRAALLADLVEVIQKAAPKEIYVTHELDNHADHRAAHWFVRDAASKAGFRDPLRTFIVHGSKTPELPMVRVQLTAAQVEKKRAAVKPHQIPIVHDTLHEHAKPEEVFFLAPVTAGKPQ